MPTADPNPASPAALLTPEADLRGLSDTQVTERVAAGRTNAQPKDTSRSLGAILRAHVLTLFNLTIALCAVVIVVLGRWFDLLFSLAAIANVVIGVVQEFSAKRKLERIALLHQDGVVVVREGERRTVRLEEVVLDDVVALRRGDQVPVDAVVLTAEGLDLDESLLTGESDPVGKTPGDTLLSGSAVVAGTGLVRATAVGADSHAARLASEARRFTRIHSELRAALETVARWLTVALVPIVAVILHGQMTAAGGWDLALSSPRETALEPALVATVAAVTAMIPQGLALMTTISFAVAALKLAQREVLIQEQPAVEILARVDTVCLDKTGTLTEGGIGFHGARDVTGGGPEGTGPDLGLPEPSAEQETHDAGPHTGASGAQSLPAAAQAALATMGADPDANTTAAALREPFPAAPATAPAGVLAFSSARRWSGVVFGPEADAETPGLAGTWLLGAPEALLDPERMGEDAARRLGEACAATADRGLRTMLLCHSAETPTGADGAGLAPPARRDPVAVLTFAENVRPDAAQTLAYFREQGVDIKVISGDSPRTVAAVARQVGVEVTGDAVDGRDLPTDPEELADVLAGASVFGRVAPEQKQAMVTALRSRGHVVAMTGDGVNDALALKTADLGIAMGNAAPATKAVSRMVLLDGRFERLPHVLREGRQVIANMERLAHIYLAKTSYALMFGVVFSLLAWPFPLLPRQASTVDFIMIGLPTFFLALMPNPRRYVPGFLRRALLFAVPCGVTIVAAMAAVTLFARHGAATAPDAAQVQTASMITLTLLGLWVLCTASRPLTWPRTGLLAGMYVLLAAVVLVPISRWYHQMELPPADLLTASLAAAAVGCAVIEVIHRVHHARVAVRD
ncbi:HAD-IC family P-type ATPase [Micrococcus sp.]|uniref:HAD-IC family P-type ATPase n=1 Tax=Micrococcus sp. TaxID=1271 RepID=UPI002A91AE6B|nr:HAD-IC family P-type ATPase [Micrococcus sp.]MDY6055864.1 HAD-IC family P-type ATPase [Micrococcus sp.]